MTHKAFKARLPFIIALFALTLSACSTIKQQVVDNISFKLQNVDSKIALKQKGGLIPDLVSDLDFTIEVSNTSPLALYLMQMDYQIYAGSYLVAEGGNQDQVKIEANGANQVVIRLSLSGTELAKQGFKFHQTKELPTLQLKGQGLIKSPVGNHAIPFQMTYEPN